MPSPFISLWLEGERFYQRFIFAASRCVMKLRLSLIIAFILVVVAQTVALQNSPQKPSQSQSDKNPPPAPTDVVKIGVTLVQVDVTVTDKQGRTVSDLRPEDFEVLQDGRPQPITNFSYVTAQPPPEAMPKVADKSATNTAVAPPARLKPERIHRTIALVVDDLTLQFGSMALVRQALKKFVDEQMQPGDLVAIVRTAAGMGALQQFTNDKRQLYAAIERVRWSPAHGTLYTFEPVTTG